MERRTHYTLSELAQLTRRSVYALSQRAAQLGVRIPRHTGRNNPNHYSLDQVRVLLSPLSPIEYRRELEGMDATGATRSPAPGAHQASAPGDDQARRNVR